MSRKREAIVDVVTFFETQPLPIVQSTLALVKAKVRERMQQDRAALSGSTVRRDHRKKDTGIGTPAVVTPPASPAVS